MTVKRVKLNAWDLAALELGLRRLLADGDVERRGAEVLLRNLQKATQGTLTVEEAK